MSAGAFGSGGELYPVASGPAGDRLSRTHQSRSYALPGEVRAHAQSQHSAQSLVPVQEPHHVQADEADCAFADRSHQNPTAAGPPNSDQASAGNFRSRRVAQFPEQRRYRRAITAPGIADCDLVRRAAEIRRRGTAARLMSRHKPLWTIGLACQIGGAS